MNTAFLTFSSLSRFLLAGLLFHFSCNAALAQYQGVDVVEVPDARAVLLNRTIRIPDVGNYKVLKCDFHTHTIFSDGQVTPEYRVREGARRGLDVIAISDHLEIRRNNTNMDHNESYKRAKSIERQADILVVPATEITRAKPIGHFNALFVTDANEMDVKNPLEAIDKAVKQGAFIMWNHPGWPNDTSTLYDVQRNLIRQNKIHGVEIANEFEFYPRAFNYCDEYNLTYLACTDIHEVYSGMYRTDRLVSPLTLVFAEDKTPEAVREALFARRTVALFGELMVGSESNLRSLIEACLPYTVESVNGNTATVQVSNVSDLTFTLRLQNKLIKVMGGAKVKIKVNLEEKIVFPCAFITDNRQLEIEVYELN
jgi:hypothetical protein